MWTPCRQQRTSTELRRRNNSNGRFLALISFGTAVTAPELLAPFEEQLPVALPSNCYSCQYMNDKAKITSLINAWREGEDGALDQLAPLVYDELRRLARRQMQDEAPSHTLQATALVHEAFVRLADVDLEYKSRAHFHAMAARTMRRILVDHARRKNSEKRGGGMRNLTLEEGSIPAKQAPASILDLDQALEELAANDEQLATAVELVFFGGLKYDEAADSMSVSRTRFAEDLRIAKAWLKTRLDVE